MSISQNSKIRIAGGLLAGSLALGLSHAPVMANGHTVNPGLTSSAQKSSLQDKQRGWWLAIALPKRDPRWNKPAIALAQAIPLPVRLVRRTALADRRLTRKARAITSFRARLKRGVTAQDVRTIRSAMSKKGKSRRVGKAGLLKILRRVKPKGLPIKLAAAVVTVESSWRPSARGSSGEYGLMQLMPGTARQFAPSFVKRLRGKNFGRVMMQPRMNLRVGTRVLHWCFKRAKGDVAATIGCYNRGPGKMWKWSGNVITKRYVGKVRRLIARAG